MVASIETIHQTSISEMKNIKNLNGCSKMAIKLNLNQIHLRIYKENSHKSSNCKSI